MMRFSTLQHFLSTATCKKCCLKQKNRCLFLQQRFSNCGILRRCLFQRQWFFNIRATLFNIFWARLSNGFCRLLRQWFFHCCYQQQRFLMCIKATVLNCCFELLLSIANGYEVSYDNGCLIVALDFRECFFLFLLHFCLLGYRIFYSTIFIYSKQTNNLVKIKDIIYIPINKEKK